MSMLICKRDKSQTFSKRETIFLLQFFFNSLSVIKKGHDAYLYKTNIELL